MSFAATPATAGNTVRQGLTVLLIATVAIGAVGCKRLSPNGMAAAATQALGVPVFLWALEDDACATKQLSKLYAEYRSWNDAGRDAMAERFQQTYSAVVVLASQDLGDMTGELKSVRLINDRRYIIDTRDVVDSRTNRSRKLPGTRIDKGSAANVEGKVLTLRPTRSLDRSIKSMYYTSNEGLFNLLTSNRASGAQGLAYAVSHGDVQVSPDGYGGMDPCGGLASVEDLF